MDFESLVFSIDQGSVYQKVKIQKEIDVQQRDQFWSQSEVKLQLSIYI